MGFFIEIINLIGFWLHTVAARISFNYLDLLPSKYSPDLPAATKSRSPSSSETRANAADMSNVEIMKLKPIKHEDDYQAALTEIDTLLDVEQNTIKDGRLVILALNYLRLSYPPKSPLG